MQTRHVSSHVHCSEGLRKLLPIKETVGQLKTHAQEVAEVIKDLITDDDAMQRLDLSQTSTHEVATQQAGGKANRSRQVRAHPHVELKQSLYLTRGPRLCVLVRCSSLSRVLSRSC